MKKIIALSIALIILTTPVFATSTSIKNQLNNVNSELKDVQNELKENKAEQKDVLKQIDTLDQNINSTETQIENTEAEIKRLENNIKIAEENIEYMQDEYNKKYELRKNRMISYYKNGTTSLWDIKNKTDDPTESAHIERIIGKILEYDTKLMEEIEEEKEKIEEEKSNLESDKIACADLKEDLEVKLANLNDTVEIRTKYLAQLKTDENLLEKSIDEIQKKADELEAELKRIASNSASSKYTGGTMTWPLPNYYTITSPFGNRLHPILKKYKLHTGIDIAGSGCNGKNIVAAADGKVITAGWLSGYGYTVMIDHGGGVVTLYAHSQKLLVKVGQKVKKGEKIALVGSTGNSTGPHLHFEVRLNGKYVNPLEGYLKK